MENVHAWFRPPAISTDHQRKRNRVVHGGRTDRKDPITRRRLSPLLFPRRRKTADYPENRNPHGRRAHRRSAWRRVQTKPRPVHAGSARGKVARISRRRKIYAKGRRHEAAHRNRAENKDP